MNMIRYWCGNPAASRRHPYRCQVSHQARAASGISDS
jgi:hypothetical protein